MRALIFFPFVRTTVDCTPSTPSGFDKSSSNWSGSDNCADRCHVAERAQLIRGFADGTEQLIQCFCLPMLVRVRCMDDSKMRTQGYLGDVLGRKPLVIISLTGLGANLTLMGLAALAETGTTVVVIPYHMVCILSM